MKNIIFLAISCIAILAVCCGLRTSFMQPDSETYIHQADFLIQYGAFSKDMIVTPGYPFCLYIIKSAVGAIGATVVIVQFGFHILAAFLLYRYISFLCSLLFLLFPVALAYTATVLPDSLFLSLLVCVLLLCSRPYPSYFWSITLGCAIGVLIMIKPVALFLGIVLFAGLCFVIPKRFAVTMLICAYLMPAGWIARNYYYNGSLTITPLIGANLCKHFVSPDNFESSIDDLPADDRFMRDKCLISAGLGMIRDWPMVYAKDVLKNAVQVFLPGESVLQCWEVLGIPRSVTFRGGRNTFVGGEIGPIVFVIISRSSFLVFSFVLPLCGLVVCLKTRLQLAHYWPFLASGLYFFVVISLFLQVYERFALPLLPSQALFGSFFIKSFLKGKRK